jgi:tetratricopeptide (TPR) repeat protein
MAARSQFHVGRLPASANTAKRIEGDMVRAQALLKLGGKILVSPDEGTNLASAGEFPLLRVLTGRVRGAPAPRRTERRPFAGERMTVPEGAAAAVPAPGSPGGRERAAEPLALAARAAWARGDAAALTRIGRNLFRLADPGTSVTGTARSGGLGATQALAREVLALGDLAAGRLAARPTAMVLPWASDPTLWLPPRLVPELLGEDFGTYRQAAGLLERLRSDADGDAARGSSPDGRGLAAALEQLASSAVALGQWPAATRYAGEGLARARLGGRPVEAASLLALLAWIAGARGRALECRRLAAQAMAIATPRSCTLVTAMIKWAQGLLDLSLGQPARALDRMAPLASSGGSTPVLLLATADLVDAAVRAGRPAAAEPLLAQLDRWVELAGPAWALADAFHCRALLSGGSEARLCFQAALDAGGVPRPFAHARVQLHYGTWLRRCRRFAEARSHLRAALDTFRRLEASSWAERAWTELLASGAGASLSASDRLPAV